MFLLLFFFGGVGLGFVRHLKGLTIICRTVSCFVNDNLIIIVVNVILFSSGDAVVEVLQVAAGTLPHPSPDARQPEGTGQGTQGKVTPR